MTGSDAGEPPLVSIVVTCHNYGRYVGAAIESALAQTHRRIEVIVVDDGSTDETRHVVESFAPRISYVYQHNQGIVAARNTGIGLLRGDFSVFLDADNMLVPTFVAETLPLAREDESVAFVYTQLEYFGVEQGVSAFPEFDPVALTRWNYVDASALIRSAVFDETRFDGYFWEGYEDWDFFLSLVERGYQGRLLDKPLVRYRRHADHESRSTWFGERRRQRRILLRMFRKHRARYGISDRLRLLVMILVCSVPGAPKVARRLGRPV